MIKWLRPCVALAVALVVMYVLTRLYGRYGMSINQPLACLFVREDQQWRRGEYACGYPLIKAPFYALILALGVLTTWGMLKVLPAGRESTN